MPDHQPRRLLRRLADVAEYLLFRAAVLTVELVPLRISLWGARRLGWATSFLLRRRLRVAEHNLRVAFGDELSPAQRRRLARASFQHFAQCLVEGICLPARIAAGRADDLIEYSGDRESLVARIEAGEPMQVLSGHVGAWELLIPCYAKLGGQVLVIIRPVKNPIVAAWVTRRRESAGLRIVLKRGAMRGILRGIAEGFSPGMLVDQNSRRGIFVDFFGRPARTQQIVGVLALRQQLPVQIVHAVRVRPGRRYRFHIDSLLQVDTSGDRDECIRRITQQVTTRIEELARANPEQYFWLHHRWKNRPDGSKEKIR